MIRRRRAVFRSADEDLGRRPRRRRTPPRAADHRRRTRTQGAGVVRQRGLRGHLEGTGRPADQGGRRPPWGGGPRAARPGRVRARRRPGGRAPHGGPRGSWAGPGAPHREGEARRHPGRGRERIGEDHHHREARETPCGARPLRQPRRERHVPSGGRRATRDLGPTSGSPHRLPAAGRRSRSRRLRRGGLRDGARIGRADRGHRRTAAHEGAADGRARQGEAGDREGRRRGRRDAAGARRDHRSERHRAGAGLHGLRRADRGRPHEDGRVREGRASSWACARSWGSRSGSSAWARAPTTSGRSGRRRSPTDC